MRINIWSKVYSNYEAYTSRVYGTELEEIEYLESRLGGEED